MTQTNAAPAEDDMDTPSRTGISLLDSEWSTQAMVTGIVCLFLWRFLVFLVPSVFQRPTIFASAISGILVFVSLLLFPLLTRRQTFPGTPRQFGPKRCLINIGWAILVTPVWLVASGTVFSVLLEFWPDMQLGEEQYAGWQQREPGTIAIIFSVVGTFLGPVIEEIFFRGFLYNAMRKRMPVAVAAVAQGILFGFMHQYSLIGMAYTAASGIFLAVLYHWRQSLIAPITAHCLYNGMMFASMLYAGHTYANTVVIGVNTDIEASGCRITHVHQGSPAETGGLEVGDNIVGLGDYRIESVDHLIAAVAHYKSGDSVTVWFEREGVTETTDVILVARKIVAQNQVAPAVDEE